jgi:predicted nucleotide-binding protein
VVQHRTGPSRVFIVHGHNLAVRDQIDLFLSRDLGLRTAVMQAGAHGGRTLPEKFEEIAASCDFAVFLLTADDHLQHLGTGARVKRARQNVILEVGYFWGALGRRHKVAFVVEADAAMELPSDIQGLGWIPLTADLGETKLRLQAELRSAGLLGK